MESFKYHKNPIKLKKMAKGSLEEKTQAPMVIFIDGTEVGGAGPGSVRVVKKEGNIIEVFASFDYKAVEGMYDAEGNPKWQNHNFDKYRQAEVPEHLRGTQVVFTDQVIYEGVNMGGHHFSFLKDGEYIGHDHNQRSALDFRYRAIKAIFDRGGKSVWKNGNYKPAKAKKA